MPEDDKTQPMDSVYVTAMAHFYRGEIGRIMQWRARLDNTTNWAITTTSTIFTVAFSLREVPHIIFLFNLAIISIMLWIEARRYRFYDAFRARVRMLEAHFLVPVVMQKTNLLQGDWRKLLSEDLLIPIFQNFRVRSGGPKAQAQLRLHLRDHPLRMDHQDLPARGDAHRRLLHLLRRLGRRKVDPKLVGRRRILLYVCVCD